jgi:hypothetical protein
MRLFQFLSCYPAYHAHFAQKYPAAATLGYAERLKALIYDRYAATHILEPILLDNPDAFIAYADDSISQSRWATEHSISTTDLDGILLAQIEEHRAEVVYSLDPIRWDSSFVRRLPGCVKKTLCWRASSENADLSAYNLRLSNFPILLRSWQSRGLRAAYFSPSHDPRMDDFTRETQPLDIAFVGGYTAMHTRRNRILEAVAGLSDRYTIVFALDHPARKPLLDIRFIRRIPGPLGYLPKPLQRLARPPVFGLEMYDFLGQAKIVVNAAGDLANEYRGNMRCFEAMGCGACMLSDEGIYPDGLVPEVHFATYKDERDIIRKIEALLETQDWRRFGKCGLDNMREHFSKSGQWLAFERLVDQI